MRYEDLEHIEVPGVVVDVNDPYKRGRVKVNVMNVFDGLDKEDIPWASPCRNLDGKDFRIPEVGQVVNINFIDGNLYLPEYVSAEHYNINLQKKLETLSDDEYSKFIALLFTDKTQIYENSKDGLMIDHKFQNINLKEDTINVNLKDNQSTLNLGTDDADQEAMLGTNWIEWFDDFVKELQGENGGPYFGNMGSPIIPAPTLIQLLAKYSAIKKQKFLSKHVNIVDNNQVNKVDRAAEAQSGDVWKSTNTTNNNPQPTSVKTPVAGIKPENDSEGYVAPQGVNDELDKSPTTPTPVSEDDPDQNPEIKKIFNTMLALNYKILDRTNELNIIGVRKQKSGDKINNQFTDELNVIYKEGETWIHKRTRITTIPGLKKAFLDPSNPKGVAILAPGQYINTWKIRQHKQSEGYQALGQNKPVFVYRDNTKSGVIHLEEKTLDKGVFGINIHKSGAVQSENVNNWSEGCQVFKKAASFDLFMKWVVKHGSLYGQDSFTYTLLTQDQVDKYGNVSDDTVTNSENNVAVQKENPSTNGSKYMQPGKIGVSNNGLSMLKKSEGSKSQIYDDKTGKLVSSYTEVKGFPTIGVGHLIKPEEKSKYQGFFLGMSKLSDIDINTLLNTDLDPREKSLNRYLKNKVTQNMFDALLSMMFNTGGGNLNFKAAIAEVNKGNYTVAADWIRKGPVSSKGKIFPGLVRRRGEEADLFLKDM